VGGLGSGRNHVWSLQLGFIVNLSAESDSAYGEMGNSKLLQKIPLPRFLRKRSVRVCIFIGEIDVAVTIRWTTLGLDIFKVELNICSPMTFGIEIFGLVFSGASDESLDRRIEFTLLLSFTASNYWIVVTNF